jgi:hypothetical protein
VAHPSSDFSQCPSLNDQRRISTTEPPIGVDVKVELSAPPPDAAPQPAPVDPTTLVPSAKSFELMRQLEALAHEVAVVSRRDSSDQCIQDGSNLSAGLQLVEPSIRVSPHDHLASDSPSFGRRTILTPVGFFTVARDWLASHRPSFGRPSAALAGFFITARDWLASYRPSFGRPSAALPGFFIAARDQLASYRPSIDKRKFPTLASFFIAALIGVAVALVWQSQRVSTANSPNEAAVAEKHSGVTPVGQLSLQDAPPQIASATQTAPASTALATSSELVQQLEAMARDLVVLQRRVEELAGKQEHLAAAQEQLTAKQEQMDQTIAKPQAVKRNTKKQDVVTAAQKCAPGARSPGIVRTSPGAQSQTATVRASGSSIADLSLFPDPKRTSGLAFSSTTMTEPNT